MILVTPHKTVTNTRYFLVAAVLGVGIKAWVPEEIQVYFAKLAEPNHENQNDIVYLDSDGGMINPFYDWLQILKTESFLAKLVILILR